MSYIPQIDEENGGEMLGATVHEKNKANQASGHPGYYSPNLKALDVTF